jgi:hypothetical protein
MGRNPFYGKASACTGDVSNYPFKSVHDTVAMPPIGAHVNQRYGGDSIVLRIKIKHQGAYTMDLFGGQPACACVGVCAKLWLYTGKPDVAPTAILPKGLDIKTVLILPNVHSNTVHQLGTLSVGDYVYVVLDHLGSFGYNEDVAYVRWRLKRVITSETTQAAATIPNNNCVPHIGLGYPQCLNPQRFTCTSTEGFTDPLLCEGTNKCCSGFFLPLFEYAATPTGTMCKTAAQRITRYGHCWYSCAAVLAVLAVE